MQTRVCSTCKQEKPIKEFGTNGNKKSNFNYTSVNGYKYSCKPCAAKYAKDWRQKQKDKGVKYRSSGKVLKYLKEDRFLISAIRWRVSDAIGRAVRRQGWKREDVTITPDYAFDLFKKQDGRCRYTDEPMSLEKNRPDTLSIDKIVPEKGYTIGNIQWVVWAVNRAKGDLSEEMFLDMCKAITHGATTIPKGSTPK